MTEVKEAPKTKTGNGQGREPAVRKPVEMQKAEAGPFELAHRLAEEMERVFEDFGRETGWHLPRFLTRGRRLFPRGLGAMTTGWSPRIDVVEREGQLMVHADLPGMSKEDVKIEVTEGMLTIEGERKEEKKEEREGYRYSECRYGSFYRCIPLPEGVDASKATAEFRKGVLEVTMPAAPRPEQKAHRVEVREKG
jgi:HSP20 family protein